MNTKQIGNYIKKQRTSLNLTQKDLADELHISFQAVSKWENDIHKIFKYLLKMAFFR